MPDDEIMTVEEVAAYLRVSERTVYDWAHKGEIPCGKLGSAWRFRRSQIESWVDRRLSGRDPAVPELPSIRSVLTADRILLLKETAKEVVLNRLLDALSTAPEVTQPEALREGIWHREELMSTGIGLGIGVPHVRLDSVRDMVMAIGINDRPIPDYVALDDAPVRIVFMIAAGKDQHAKYIRLLSAISARFKSAVQREALLDAPDAEAVFDLLAANGTKADA